MIEDHNAHSIWVMLLKFGQKQNLEKLRKTGLVYANHISYFQKKRGDLLRDDRFEGSGGIVQPQDIKKLTISRRDGNPIVLGPNNFGGPLIYSNGQNTNCNVYCMYSITAPDEWVGVDSRNLDFGDSYIVILDTQEFLNRVRREANRLGFSCGWQLIDYFDAKTYSGETGPFRKPATFSNQCEFRLAFSPGIVGPLQLQLGSLEDITTPVGDLAEINTEFQFVGWSDEMVAT